MRSIFCFLGALGMVLCSSCATDVPDRKAGGGAFDDSYLSRRLDSNNPNLYGAQTEDGKPAVPSYEQWRASE